MRETRVGLAAAFALLGMTGSAVAADIPVGNLVD
jgi:hypothetical protein